MLSLTHPAKRIVKSVANSFGLQISRVRDGTIDHAPGVDSDNDIQTLLAGISSPIVFDVGANTGQSVRSITTLLGSCEVHSFEPGPVAFRQFETATREIPNLHRVNAAVGSVSGRQVFLENTYSDMSSFLRPAKAAWGNVISKTLVDVITIDEYTERHNVERIDLLKIDTQGYELEVLKGATRAMLAARIRLIYLEVIFSEMYDDLPPFDVMYRFLLDHGFGLVAFYEFELLGNHLASWANALFLNPECPGAPG